MRDSNSVFTRAGVVIVALAAGCGGESGVAQQAGESAESSGAVVEYDGERYELSTYAQCGADDDGVFDTWAVTMSDEAGTAVDGAPRLHVSGKEGESLLQFYKKGTEPEVQLMWMVGGGLAFEDKTLHFDGDAAGVGGGIQVTIICP